MSLRLEEEGSLKYHSEKINTASNNHGCTQKCDICVSVGKTNFTDHHTPDTINDFRYSVLVCKMHDYYCTVGKISSIWNRSNEARLDIRTRRFWNRDQQAFFDIRVFDPNACRYLNKSMQLWHAINEHEKKGSYNERMLQVDHGTFTPLEFSI